MSLSFQIKCLIHSSILKYTNLNHWILGSSKAEVNRKYQVTVCFNTLTALIHNGNKEQCWSILSLKMSNSTFRIGNSDGMYLSTYLGYILKLYAF